MSTSLSCKLLLLLLRVFLSTGANLTVYGPVVAKPIFQDLRTAFMLVRPYTIDYSIAQSNPSSYLAMGSPVLVDTGDINNLQFTSASLKFNLWGFPLVVVFNLNGPSNLRLTQQVLVDIALGRITRWNDGNLTRINPGTTLPDQPITLVVGSLLDRFFEGFSVLANQTLNVSSLSKDNTLSEGPKVCSKVISTPYSLGFSWMGDAVSTGARLAQLQNRDGFFVSPGSGASFALAEYRMAQKYGLPGTPVVTLHNLPGHLTWPLMNMYWLVVPQKLAECSQVEILQSFLSFAMQFTLRLSGMDQLIQLQGWQPAKSQVFLDVTLGAITPPSALVDNIFSIPCGSSTENPYHNVGASAPLWGTLLKMMGPYTGEFDASLRLSGSSNITYLLDNMASQQPQIDIDLVLTWDLLLKPYPELFSVPMFMASVVPFVNIGTVPPTLSMPVLADIFSGVITQWNDARIEALNPDLVLPEQPIVVFAAPITVPDDDTAIFARVLSDYSSNFSWARASYTDKKSNIFEMVQFTPYSIGYGYGRNVEDSINQVPRLLNANNVPIRFSTDSLAACWASVTAPNCWPIPLRQSIALRRPDRGVVSCQHQQVSVRFVNWALTSNIQFNQFQVRNPSSSSMGEAELCQGRSLVVTRAEPQVLNVAAKNLVYALVAIGLFWTICQAIALGVARKQSELKSASVLFSLLAVNGVFLILQAPLMIVQDSPSKFDCGLSVWLLVIGFSLCYGSLFAKLFRLYTIFTSRKLVVPRLSNRKLLVIVMVFLAIDFVLLLAYSIYTPPEPYVFSAYVHSDADLVTGDRHFTMEACSFHGDSEVLYVIMIVKLMVALCGAGMAFVIRQVDRRFTATSALGWAFYNMFLTVAIAILVLGVFTSGNDLEFRVFVPVFCGLWIMFVTLVALTMDSNVLLACRDFSRPLRRLLSNNSNNSKDSKEREVSRSTEKAPGAEPNRSHSSTTFVVNREMFPSKYEDFDPELLEKIRDELKFQLLAVRRALVSTSAPSTTTSSRNDSDLIERQRGSTNNVGPHRLTSAGSAAGLGGSPRTAERCLTNSEAGKSLSIELPELYPRTSSKPREPELSSIKVESDVEAD